MFERNGEIHDYARRPPRLAGVRDAYALWVSGDSMSPWREEGELIYAHPHAPVLVNDYVVVQMKPEKPIGPQVVYVKRLVRRTEREVTLCQFNPPEKLTLKTAEIATIHKILGWSELMGI